MGIDDFLGNYTESTTIPIPASGQTSASDVIGNKTDVSLYWTASASGSGGSGAATVTATAGSSGTGTGAGSTATAAAGATGTGSGAGAGASPTGAASVVGVDMGVWMSCIAVVLGFGSLL